MSAGIPSFGALPQLAGLSPDDLASLMQRLGVGQQQPAVAMNEGQTQGLERQMGSPADLAALGGSPIDQLLYDRAGMGGGANAFRGSADPYGARAVPLPPGRPDDAALMMPEPAVTGGLPQRQVLTSSVPGESGVSNSVKTPTSPGPKAAPDAGGPLALPSNSFDPLTGQPTAGSPRPLGQPQAVSGAPPGASAGLPGLSGAPQAANPGGQSGSFFERFIQGLSRPEVSDALGAFGAGLLSARGSEGWSRAMDNMQRVSQVGDARQLAQFKLRQEMEGQNATFQHLTKNLGVAPDVARAAVLNPTILNGLLTKANKDPQQFTVNGKVYLGRPDQPMSSWQELGSSSGPPTGYQVDPNNPRGVIYQEGGPEDPKVKERNAKAVATDKEQTPLTDPQARQAAGIPAYDMRPAWKDPNGKVTFDNGPTPKITTTRNPDGSSTAREYDPATRSFREVPGGGNPGVDTTGVPPGVDPLTYRREAAKAEVAERKGASTRALQAQSALPILDRAQTAYERLAQNGGIGPFAASTFNRNITGALGRQNEIDRQEYEAAAKDLELQKAQISMKGQGAITDSERRILALTLPRLDHASPETGLSTLKSMRDQFGRAINAEGLPSNAGQPQSNAMGPVPGGAVQALQQDPGLRDQFDAKYGRGAAARFLGGR